jgi:uncharacterized membrane protein
MSKKKKRQPSKENQRESKKAAVLGNEKKSATKLMGIIIGLVLAGGAVWGYMTYDKSVQETAPSKGVQSANENAQAVVYPVHLFEDGRARHFEYRHGDMTIKYFILKSSDGVIRAAFDACDVCWPAGLGYYQEGDKMVCRNCGRRFASILVNEVKGGCNPAPLHRQVDGEALIIKKEDILEGKRYFDFKGKV